MLDPVAARGPVPYSAEPRPNPLVDLPTGWRDLLTDVDAVLLTHLHEDHLDGAGLEWLSSGVAVYCQPADATELRARGLQRVHAVEDLTRVGCLRLVRIDGQHGFGDLAEMLGPVSGFVIAAPDGGGSIYVAGDTMWCASVQEAIRCHDPDVIVVNAGGARLEMGEPVTMTPKDVVAVATFAEPAFVIAVHMDAINHCADGRLALRAHLNGLGVQNVVVPDDGGRISLPTSLSDTDGSGDVFYYGR